MFVSNTLSGLRGALPDLAEEARARATEFESLRKLAPDFANRLKRAGVFRILVPADAGGLAASLEEWLEIVMTLAEADASTGWVSAHGGICSGLIYASADERFRQEFFADPNACAAWSNVPRIKAVEEADGIRITGSWSFESGCTAATFVGGVVPLPPVREGGPPRIVAALAPAADATIEETWDPVGLAGTGSHDVRFDNLLVPWHRTFRWPSGVATAAYPAAIFVPGVWFITVGAAATHLGLARRALDEARRELAGKTDRYTGTKLMEHPATHQRLEAAEGLWFACRAGLREAMRAMWACAQRGVPAPSDVRIVTRNAAVTAVQQGAEIVRTAYETAGAGALRRDGVLQRLLRDASCLTQHVSANRNSYELTGRVRAGIDKLSFRV